MIYQIIILIFWTSLVIITWKVIKNKVKEVFENYNFIVKDEEFYISIEFILYWLVAIISLIAGGFIITLN